MNLSQLSDPYEMIMTGAAAALGIPPIETVKAHRAKARRTICAPLLADRIFLLSPMLAENTNLVAWQLIRIKMAPFKDRQICASARRRSRYR